MLTIFPTTNYNTNFKAAPNYKKIAGQITALTNEEKIIPKTKLPNKFVITTADCKKKIIALKKQLHDEIKNKIKNFHFNIPLIFYTLMAGSEIIMGICGITCGITLITYSEKKSKVTQFENSRSEPLGVGDSDLFEYTHQERLHNLSYPDMINKADQDGYTDAHYLCKYGDYYAMKKLTESPLFDPNRRTNDGLSYIDIANKYGHYDIVNLIVLDKRYNPNLTDKLGNTDAFYFCTDGNYEAMKTLLKNHPEFDINKRNNGISYVSIAHKNGYNNIVNLFLTSKQYNANRLDKQDKTDAYYFCIDGNYEAMKTLLENHPDFDINYQNYARIAELSGHPDIARLLLTYKYNKNILN